MIGADTLIGLYIDINHTSILESPRGILLPPFLKADTGGEIYIPPARGMESQREAKPLLKIYSPFPFLRGRGIQGDGVHW